MIGDYLCDFFGWDWGTPAILQQNPNKITLLHGCGFGFIKVGIWSDPPLLGTKLVLGLPLLVFLI